uniref:Major facilitator superfamily (MFS) profile domain-containing protein n=1 Tax=Ciona savignyi TaxID=51511 RepID=H2ZQJ6_CIOSA
MFGYLLGVGELYMFWLAEERFNAASVLLGVSVIMSSAFDVLMYVLSSGLIRKFGPNIIISVGLVLLGIRLLLFTFARHAWQLILADSLRGISFAVMWVSTCQLILQLSPPGLRATTMGLVQAGLWGLGYGTAALFGGVMYERLGADTMFRVSFFMSLIVAMFYVIFFVSHDRWQRSKERKKNNNNDDEVKSLAEEAVCNIDFINQENEETIRNQVENSHV